jgi:hypothetical protein
MSIFTFCLTERLMDYQTWFTFFAAACVIAISPGSGAVLSMSHGLNYGVRRTSATILGLEIALVVILVIGITVSGWAIAWGRGKRIDTLKATVAAAQARAAEFEDAYNHLAVVVVQCNQATVAMEAAAQDVQESARQAVAKARTVAAPLRQQAGELRAAVAPPERSCEAADRLVLESLR